MATRTAASGLCVFALMGISDSTRWRMRGMWQGIFQAEGNAKIAVGMGYEASDDFGRAVDYLKWLGADDVEAAFAEAWCEASELIGKHWPALIRFASLLKSRLRIEDSELYELPDVKAVLEALPDPDPEIWGFPPEGERNRG